MIQGESRRSPEPWRDLHKAALEIRLCLRDSQGSYAEILTRLAGLNDFSTFGPAGHDRFRRQFWLDSVRYSLDGALTPATYLRAYLGVYEDRQPPCQLTYEEAIRSALILAEKDSLARARAFLAPDPDPGAYFSELQVDGAEALVDAVRRAERADACPEISRCPFTPAKRWLLQEIVERLDGQASGGSSGLSAELHYIPSSSLKPETVEEAATYFEDPRIVAAPYGELEVRLDSGRSPGELAVVFNSLLFKCAPRPAAREAQKDIVNLSFALTEVCDNHRYTFDTIRGQLLSDGEGGRSQRSWIDTHLTAPAVRQEGAGVARDFPIRAVFISAPGCANEGSEEGGLAHWGDYARDLAEFLNAAYGRRFIALRWKLGTIPLVFLVDFRLTEREASPDRKAVLDARFSALFRFPPRDLSVHMNVLARLLDLAPVDARAEEPTAESERSQLRQCVRLVEEWASGRREDQLVPLLPPLEIIGPGTEEQLAEGLPGAGEV